MTDRTTTLFLGRQRVRRSIAVGTIFITASALMFLFQALRTRGLV